MTRLALEIVTPKGRAVQASADEVVVPAASGELGVLPGHLPTLAALRSGIVGVRYGSESRKVAVAGGFAEIGPEKVLILTDSCVEREALDPVVLRKELAEVQTALTRFDGSPLDAGSPEKTAERKALVAKESWIATQLELYGDPPPPTMRPLDDLEASSTTGESNGETYSELN